VVAEGLTLTGVPLATATLPGVITPVPLAKTAVRLALVPASMAAGLAAKLEMDGGVGAVGAELEQPANPSEARPSARVAAAGTWVSLKVIPLSNRID
jgi:hypothetical protein